MAVRPIEVGTTDNALLSFDGLRAQLRRVGEERYHHQHPFHLMMHEGRLSRGQLQAWALNRYYYQAVIPIKDSIILSRGPDPGFRRAWRKRVIDHVGAGEMAPIEERPAVLIARVPVGTAVAAERGDMLGARHQRRRGPCAKQRLA